MARAPIEGVSVAIFRDARVLVVRRAKEPNRGLWSLPGGQVEPGESARHAALREVREETGVAIELTGLVDTLDFVAAGAEGRPDQHYVLRVFAGCWRFGEASAASDCSDARWVTGDEIGDLEMTEGAMQVIARAAAMLGGGDGSRFR